MEQAPAINNFRNDRAIHGFSLIELIIVIGIVGVLSAIAVVRLSNGNAAGKTKLVARQIISDIRYAHELARTSGKSVEVQFNIASNYYHIRYSSGEMVRQPLGGREYIIRLGEPPYESIRLTSTNLSNGLLRFDFRGMPYSGANLMQQQTTVVNLNNVAWITIEPFSGKLNVNFIR